MSLRSMAVMRAEAETAAAEERREAERGERPGPFGAPPARAGAAGTKTQDTALKRSRDQLVALIPAEAVALFVLLIGLTAKEALGVRLAMLAVVVAFTVGWIVLSYWEAKGGRRGAGLPGWEIGIGLVAFLAWSTSVPASPWTDLDLPTWTGPAVVAVVSALLVFVARLRVVWAANARDTDPKPEPAVVAG